MKNTYVNEFLKKYAENKYTEQEHQEFIDWLNGQSLNTAKKVLKEYYHINKDTSKIRSNINRILTDESRQKLLFKIEQHIVDTDDKVKHIRSYNTLKKIAATAALLVVSLSVFYYFMNPNSLRVEKTPGKQNEITQITSLILQDGSVLNLDSIGTGEEIIQGSVKIQR